MKFTIRHHTVYRYSHPVRLGPQLLRFHPRDDGAQRIVDHRMSITPTPTGRNDHICMEGNRVTGVWFEGETDRLEIDMTMEVETLRRNAFDYILSPEAMVLPVSHTHDVVCAQCYLQRIDADDAATAFAAELSLAVNRDTLSFLDHLNRQIYAEFTQVIRDKGEPQSPALTLLTRQGACRDLAALFVDCCRAEGIPARFASGYQKGHERLERRYLHAWPEVYLPGAGWRGYDPTHGEVLADTHVTVAAAAHPRDTMPVSGSFRGERVTSSLDFTVEIKVSDE